MFCQACDKVPTSQDNQDCFVKALDILKQHYTFYKNALKQRDLELEKVKERNEKLNKALQLLQNKNQKTAPPSKRFKGTQQNSDDYWLESNPERLSSDVSLTDDGHNDATNLNMAFNSEQIFDTSALSPPRNDNFPSSEIVRSPRIKESPKRIKQRSNFKDFSNKKIPKSTVEWHTKERNSPSEKSWATKFLNPSQQADKALEKNVDLKKTDKRLCLSLKKSNPSKMKQSLIHFNKTKDESIRGSDVGGEDIIEASPMVAVTNPKHMRSWAHRLQKRPELQFQQHNQLQQCCKRLGKRNNNKR